MPRLLIILFLFGNGSFLSHDTEKSLLKMAEITISPAATCTEFFKISNGSTFSKTMKRNGFEWSDIQKIVKIGSQKLNFNNLNTSLRFGYTGDRSQLVVYLDNRRRINFSKTHEDWITWQTEFSEQIEHQTFQGTVKNSLWDSALRAKMSPDIIMQMTEIFAWQIDFSREVRKKDQWRITIEKKSVSGQFSQWGKIIAAEYINNDRSYKAFWFEHEETKGYFDERGQSLQKIFLKNPIKFARISSRFSRRRFHPIRKVYRPHLGVDYAAPRGTPIRSVGDGVVAIRGRRGGAGKMIKIRHNSVYETAYMHLDRYARNLRVGSKIKQGQVIGYVGQTGLATGPHLHYEFYKNKHYVDPLSVEFPSAHPIPSAHLSRYNKLTSVTSKLLPEWADEVATKFSDY